LTNTDFGITGLPMNIQLLPYVAMLAFYIPPLIIVLWVSRAKRAHQAFAAEPFTEQPFRLAGESTAAVADSRRDSVLEDMGLLLITCPMAGLLFALVPGPNRLIICLIAFIAVSIGAFVVGRRLINNLAEAWDYRLGAKGEQVVGRELDRLIAQGYQVFHDVPFDGWNIDHIAVGPRGVFAIETKAWRKQTGLKAEIIFDGAALILPGKSADPKALEQAKRNAHNLTTWIADAAAEDVTVVAVVALPGWKLSIQKYGEVAVYSAKNMSDHMPQRGKNTLTPEQIQRISFQLAKICRVTAAD
jgi:hypothetical protein